jgi:hypothetical protein
MATDTLREIAWKMLGLEYTSTDDRFSHDEIVHSVHYFTGLPKEEIEIMQSKRNIFDNLGAQEDKKMLLERLSEHKDILNKIIHNTQIESAKKLNHIDIMYQNAFEGKPLWS